MTNTKMIDGTVNLISALLGRLPGGAGYVVVVVSAFMGSMPGADIIIADIVLYMNGNLMRKRQFVRQQKIDT